MGSLSGATKTSISLGNKQGGVTANATSLEINLTTENPFEIDTTSAYGSNQIDQVQTIFVDNSQNPYSLEINLLQMGSSSIILPPNCQAYVPILVSNPARFSIGSTYTGIIPIILLSLAVPAQIWFPEGATGGSDEVVSDSVTIPNGQALSDSVKRNALSLIGFQLPASVEGTQLEIKGSLTDGSFVSLFSSAGQKAVYDISGGAGIYYVSDYAETQAANYFAFQTQDSSGAAQNQTGAAVIVPIFAKV